MTQTELQEAAEIARRWAAAGRIRVAAPLSESEVDAIVNERQKQNCEATVEDGKSMPEYLDEFLNLDVGEFTSADVLKWLHGNGLYFEMSLINVTLTRHERSGKVECIGIEKTGYRRKIWRKL